MLLIVMILLLTTANVSAFYIGYISGQNKKLRQELFDRLGQLKESVRPALKKEPKRTDEEEKHNFYS